VIEFEPDWQPGAARSSMSRGPAGTPVMSGSLLMPRTMAVLWMCRRPCGAVGRSGRLVSRTC